MHASVRFAAIVLGLAPVGAVAADSIQFRPGKWEVRVAAQRVTLDGEDIALDTLGETDTTDSQCVSPDMAKDPSRYFMEVGPADDCTSPNGKVGDGKIAMIAQCKIDDGVVGDVAVIGEYDQDSYHATARMKAALGDHGNT